MIADTRLLWGSQPQVIYNKIRADHHHGLLALSGRPGDLDVVLEWLDDPTRDRPVLDESTAIQLTHNGCIFTYTQPCAPIKREETVVVIGSGSEYVYGAIAAGATYEKAMRIAAQYDIYTAAPFIEMRFEPDGNHVTTRCFS